MAKPMLPVRVLCALAVLSCLAVLPDRADDCNANGVADEHDTSGRTSEGVDQSSLRAEREPGCVVEVSTKLLPSDGAAGDKLGQSVSVSGSVAVVGAPYDDDAGSSSGSA